eukprot:scaffold6820_cov69-Phaeocystis_antarctica.AAC.4
MLRPAAQCHSSVDGKKSNHQPGKMPGVRRLTSCEQAFKYIYTHSMAWGFAGAFYPSVRSIWAVRPWCLACT